MIRAVFFRAKTFKIITNPVISLNFSSNTKDGNENSTKEKSTTLNTTTKSKSDAEILKDHMNSNDSKRKKSTDKNKKPKEDGKKPPKHLASDGSFTSFGGQSNQKTDADVLSDMLDKQVPISFQEKPQKFRIDETRLSDDLLASTADKKSHEENMMPREGVTIKSPRTADSHDTEPIDLSDMLDNISYHQVSMNFDQEIAPSSRGSFLRKIDPSKRLNIFNGDNTKKSPAKSDVERVNIMDIIDSCEHREMVMMPPENQFDEWMMLTKDKKLWKFPIDNEQDSAELMVGFHEHVFPQQYLTGVLPTSGIIGQYMNLVVLGLSQSPHLTVSQKKEHIRWYEEYFSSKLGDITAALEKSKEQEIYEESLRTKQK